MSQLVMVIGPESSSQKVMRMKRSSTIGFAHAGVYRKEQWGVPLAAALLELRECAHLQHKQKVGTINTMAGLLSQAAWSNCMGCTRSVTWGAITFLQAWQAVQNQIYHAAMVKRLHPNIGASQQSSQRVSNTSSS